MINSIVCSEHRQTLTSNESGGDLDASALSQVNHNRDGPNFRDLCLETSHSASQTTNTFRRAQDEISKQPFEPFSAAKIHLRAAAIRVRDVR